MAETIVWHRETAPSKEIRLPVARENFKKEALAGIKDEIETIISSKIEEKFQDIEDSVHRMKSICEVMLEIFDESEHCENDEEVIGITRFNVPDNVESTLSVDRGSYDEIFYETRQQIVNSTFYKKNDSTMDLNKRPIKQEDLIVPSNCLEITPEKVFDKFVKSK